MYPDGVKFMAAKTFQTEFGTYTAGDEVKDARKFRNLEVLVRAGFLYPYAPDKGYEYLPPAIFSAVQTKAEAKAKIDGDPSAKRNVDYEQPEVVKTAEKTAERQYEAYQLIRDQGDKKLRAALQRRDEKVDKPVDEQVGKGKQVKETAEKTEAKEDKKPETHKPETKKAETKEPEAKPTPKVVKKVEPTRRKAHPQSKK